MISSDERERMVPLHLKINHDYHVTILKRSYPSTDSLDSLDSTSSFHTADTSDSVDSTPRMRQAQSFEYDTPEKIAYTHPRTQRTRAQSFDYSPDKSITSQESFFADDNSEVYPRFRPASKWLIPADHPYKILWDVATILISMIGAYHGHTSIRDRSFGPSLLTIFCEVWFVIDILLNFVTQHKSSMTGVVLKDGKSVWARYLTTWFVVDFVSLLPWETLYVKPIIDMQNRRKFFKKAFFRTKAVIRVTRILRGRHFKLFRTAAKTTKHAGVGARGLLKLLIKYLPKYIFFWRRMKGVVLVRLLRHFHTLCRFFKIFQMKEDDETQSLSSWEELDDDDDNSFDLY